jgi:hypothetical protein
MKGHFFEKESSCQCVLGVFVHHCNARAAREKRKQHCSGKTKQNNVTVGMIISGKRDHVRRDAFTK